MIEKVSGSRMNDYANNQGEPVNNNPKKQKSIFDKAEEYYKNGTFTLDEGGNFLNQDTLEKKFKENLNDAVDYIKNKHGEKDTDLNGVYDNHQLINEYKDPNNGDKVKEYKDGHKVINHKDGTTTETYTSGELREFTNYDKDGNQIKVYSDGRREHYNRTTHIKTIEYPDGTVTVNEHSNDKSTTTYNNGIVETNTRYKNIIKYPDDGRTVTTNKENGVVTTVYPDGRKSVVDKKNNTEITKTKADNGDWITTKITKNHRTECVKKADGTTTVTEYNLSDGSVNSVVEFDNKGNVIKIVDNVATVDTVENGNVIDSEPSEYIKNRVVDYYPRDGARVSVTTYKISGTNLEVVPGNDIKLPDGSIIEGDYFLGRTLDDAEKIKRF